MLCGTNFIHPPKVDGTGAAISAVDRVTLVEQEFGEIGAILAGGTGDDGYFGYC